MIASTWLPSELRQAEALARLEGWGQEKRRTASILAEMHNVSRLESWARGGDDKQPLPKMMTESDFLPKRVKRKAADPAKAAVQQAKAEQSLSSIMNGLCGYRSGSLADRGARADG